MNGTAHLLLQRKTGSSDALPFSGKRNHYFSGFVLMGTDPLFFMTTEGGKAIWALFFACLPSRSYVRKRVQTGA